MHLQVCESTLATHLFKTLPELIPYLLLGLGGIWGWGIAVERVVRKRTSGFHFSHAFIEGTVVVSILRLLTSLLGWVHSSHGIALCGVLAGGLLLKGSLAHRKTVSLSASEKISLGFLFALAGAFAVLLVCRPIATGDQTAIWAYHAKALTCETLFGSSYVNEPYWAGTHPEYPLYYSFLHSYFFALMDSFRDDVVKIWQAVAVLCLVPILFFGLKRFVQSTAFRFLVVVSVVFWLQNLGREASPELCAAVFTCLLTFCVLSGDWARMPIYLLGLATTKNESTVSAVALLVLLVVFRVRPRRYLAAAGMALFAWLLVARSLPSLHEQYPRQALQWAVWIAGFKNLPEILAGYWRILSGFPFGYIVAAVIGCLFTRPARWPWEYRLLALWPLVLLPVYLIVFVISPWGPGLYSITLSRLLFPTLVPWLIVSALVLFQHFPRARPMLLVLWWLAYFNAAVMHHWVHRGWHFVPYQAVREAPAEIWAIDRATPPQARIAYLPSEEQKDLSPILFQANYFLYPRKLYVCSPQIVQGTWRGNFRWSEPELAAKQWKTFDAVVP